MRQTTSLEQLRPLCQEHPLDFYCYARAAQLLDSKGDRDAVLMLNHAMQLHPYHPGLHVLAAQLLLRNKLVTQATVEYGLALRGSLEPRPLLAEIIARFPAAVAATAIPTDYARLDEIANTLIDLDHRDVALAWVERVLDHRGSTMRGCEQLYAIVLPTKDLEILGRTVTRCSEFEPDRPTRIALAQTFLANDRFSEVVKLLHDVAAWDGRIDDKRAAWLMLCDAKLGLKDWNDARHCLHEIEISGLADAATGSAISTRLEQIAKALGPN
jgi:hypothetical protein